MVGLIYVALMDALFGLLEHMPSHRCLGGSILDLSRSYVQCIPSRDLYGIEGFSLESSLCLLVEHMSLYFKFT